MRYDHSMKKIRIDNTIGDFGNMNHASIHMTGNEGYFSKRYLLPVLAGSNGSVRVAAEK